MSTAQQSQDPEANVYTVVHAALQWGMWISSVLYGLGVVSALRHPLRISLQPGTLLSWPATIRGLLHFQPSALMLAATVILILTPVARVVLAIMAFWRDRDWRFVGVTGVVFGVIVLTVILGRLGLH